MGATATIITTTPAAPGTRETVVAKLPRPTRSSTASCASAWIVRISQKATYASTICKAVVESPPGRVTKHVMMITTMPGAIGMAETVAALATITNTARSVHAETARLQPKRTPALMQFMVLARCQILKETAFAMTGTIMRAAPGTRATAVVPRVKQIKRSFAKNASAWIAPTQTSLTSVLAK